MYVADKMLEDDWGLTGLTCYYLLFSSCADDDELPKKTLGLENEWNSCAV